MYPILLSLLLLAAPADDWTTEFERSGGRLTATYQETIDYCRRLDKASKWIRFESFGKSGEGRELPLLIVDKNGDFSAEHAHKRGKAIVLVQAGIHSGEIDGKDAGLILIREMAITRERESLLDHVTLVFIPIYNVDGHEHVAPYNRVNQKGPDNAGFRANATFLNLNRDYMKADAPETRAWLSLWNRWDPDLLVDCHVTNGADYPYVVTYLVEVFENADPGVAAWTRDRFVPPLGAGMRESGFPLVHYVDFRDGHDPKSGLKTWASTPRFSTGYVALANRPALLVETHMLKDYASRVRGTHAILGRTLEIAGREAKDLRRINVEADARSASLWETKPEAGGVVPLRFETDYSDSVMIDFEGYEYRPETSDVTGGTWHRYGTTPVAMRVPLFHRQKATLSVLVPQQYWIPPQWTDVIARLEAHGIEMTRLAAPQTEHTVVYRLLDPKWASTPFEGRHTVTYDVKPFGETRTYPAGTVVVDMAQRRSRIAVHLLNPSAPDALAQWGFFDTVFEAKEYVEDYVMEEIAREMLSDSSFGGISRDVFARRFREAMRDTALAGHPERVRAWFYKNSPYAETRVGEYPVVSVSRVGIQVQY
ncbi:MAG: M14 family metallopeptidase [Candidatus Latescibacteria bacterium]|nr:M14 family metallopeptidase [Candidatus Latescibacterota bacterium]